MDDITKRKIEAAAEMAWGSFRCVSGAATGLGFGVYGAFLRHHGHMQSARLIAKNSIEAGVRSFNRGLQNWTAADRPQSESQTEEKSDA